MNILEDENDEETIANLKKNPIIMLADKDRLQ